MIYRLSKIIIQINTIYRFPMLVQYLFNWRLERLFSLNTNIPSLVNLVDNQGRSFYITFLKYYSSQAGATVHYGHPHFLKNLHFAQSRSQLQQWNLMPAIADPKRFNDIIWTYKLRYLPLVTNNKE